MKTTVITAIENIDLTINQNNHPMKIQRTYSTDFAKGNGVYFETINCISESTFVSDNDYDFKLSFDMLAENNVKSKMIITFHANYYSNNKFHVDCCKYEK
jgi:hypothetical protein